MYAGAMRLDGPTLQNLEILSTPEGGTEGSLLARLDSCVYPGTCPISSCSSCRQAALSSIQLFLLRGEILARSCKELRSCSYAGGHRLLRKWLCRPLRHIPDINDRLDAVGQILDRPSAAGVLRKALSKQV